jgi:hypothetical protein
MATGASTRIATRIVFEVQGLKPGGFKLRVQYIQVVQPPASGVRTMALMRLRVELNSRMLRTS